MKKISRSKIDLFVECPRCFWLDVKEGVKRPSFPPYTINNAVDYLLKQEFDLYREKQEPHPFMVKHGVDAVPFSHENMNTWRHNFTGVQHQDEESGFLVTGAVDDIWASPKGELYVVDYKATGAKEHKIYDSYMRQMEIYQWLLKQNGFEVSPTGYFIFARVDKGKGFEGTLPFDLFLESYSGDDSWIPQTLGRIKETYKSDELPAPSEACEYCAYREGASRFS